MTIAAFTFAFLAVLSTYGISNHETILRWAGPSLQRWGLPDLLGAPRHTNGDSKPKRIFLLGCHWTGSSLLAEIQRHKPTLLTDVLVIDFNPQIIPQLRSREIDVVYGDISQRDTLLHAGIAHAEIIICSLPNTLLKGTTNLKLLRQVRSLNATAQTIVHAERLADLPDLYAAGASYVIVPRLLEAEHLLQLLDAAQKNLLDEKREQEQRILQAREEVVS